MSFNNVDALAEAYDAVSALFDRLRECAAVDRRDGHRGCFGSDYKDSSVVGIRSQRCAHVAVDIGSCRSNYVVNAVYGVVAAVLNSRLSVCGLPALLKMMWVGMSEVSTVPVNVHFQIKLPFAALPIIVARSPGHFALAPPVKLVFVVLLQHQTLTFLYETSKI